jgi:catechol 2,3-dioxygenase-like lactoylglutathione lyase family enzyme
MFDHVTIRVTDRTASERFYDTVLTPLGIDRTYRTGTFSEWQDFSLTGADGANPPTRRLHVAFGAPSHEQVDEFWLAGTAAGYTDDGRPGPRPEYRSDYYGAFLLDPGGNSAEAVHHAALRRGGIIDHLWIRVADVAAAKRFYETIAPHAGLRLRDDTPDRVQFAGTSGSISLVRGTPTENLHMRFSSSMSESTALEDQSCGPRSRLDRAQRPGRGSWTFQDYLRVTPRPCPDCSFPMQVTLRPTGAEPRPTHAQPRCPRCATTVLRNRPPTRMG